MSRCKRNTSRKQRKGKKGPDLLSSTVNLVGGLALTAIANKIEKKVKQKGKVGKAENAIRTVATYGAMGAFC